MSDSKNAAIKNREAFLQTLVEHLSANEQFLAAWLTGSFARGEQDILSDIDITLVVDDETGNALCVRPWMVSAQTTKERYHLFSSFGRPVLIHENHHNAPEGGTFTFVAYNQDAVMVDWILRPLTGAEHPEGSRLLFDQAGIPIQSPAKPVSQAQRADEASEIMAFFWMMTAVTVKYIYRGDGVFVNTWLEELTKLVYEVERRIGGRALPYRRGSSTLLSMTSEEQFNAIRRLSGRMEDLAPEVNRIGGVVPEAPMATIEPLIGIARERTRSD